MFRFSLPTVRTARRGRVQVRHPVAMGVHEQGQVVGPAQLGAPAKVVAQAHRTGGARPTGAEPLRTVDRGAQHLSAPVRMPRLNGLRGKALARGLRLRQKF